MNTTHRRLREEKGFTLVELLIVVVILGVLSGIVVFAIGNFAGEGEAEACNADVKTVEVAQEAHRAKTGAYAASVSALKTAGYLRDTPATVSTSTTGAVAKAGSCA